MQVLWICALAIGLAAAEGQETGVAPGCGDPSPDPSAAKKEVKKYGIFTDVNGCKHKVLQSYEKLRLTSCVIECPKYNKTAPFRSTCLQLLKKTVQEREDSAPKTCRVGRCVHRRCVLGPTTQKCWVPEDSKDYRE
uniref:Evasin n=1 Tax=Amblyomma cajennense TaxID=34607 RepID=A0A023FR77_AMBCJ